MIEAAFVNPIKRFGILSQLPLANFLHTQIDQIERWTLDEIRRDQA